MMEPVKELKNAKEKTWTYSTTIECHVVPEVAETETRQADTIGKKTNLTVKAGRCWKKVI